jgi:hypothetical protein
VSQSLFDFADKPKFAKVNRNGDIVVVHPEPTHEEWADFINRTRHQEINERRRRVAEGEFEIAQRTGQKAREE